MSTFSQTKKKLEDVTQCKESACDIETRGKASKTITAIGFSLGNPYDIVVLPMALRYFTEEQQHELWPIVRHILENVPIIGQNFLFDWDVLYENGCPFVNLSWDTMVAQHLLFTDLPRNLPTLVSLFTDRGPHKQLVEEDLDIYNGLDVGTTHEVKEEQYLQIMEQNEVDAQTDLDQMRHLMSLHRVLLTMQKRGLRIQPDWREEARVEMQATRERLQSELAEMVGWNLNPNSSPQLQKHFYEDHGLKPYINKHTKRPRVDQDALERLAYKGFPEANKILEIKEVGTLMDRYFNMNIDNDYRVRCQIKVTGTKTGRLATAKTPAGTGTNLQNLPPEFGKCVIPDDGCIFLEADLDQAEKRLVALITGDERNINDFKQGIDIHVAELARVWGVDPSEITKEQRNKIGKPLNHMTSYGVQGATFAANIGVPAAEGKKILNRYYHQEHPSLPKYFREIEAHIKQKSITIRNLFGRPRRFMGARDAAEMRSAYDYMPQSTIGEICNRSAEQLFDEGPTDLQIMMQNHDSLLFQVPDDIVRIQELWPQIERAMWYTFTYRGNTLDIPVEFNLLPCWSKKLAVEVKENTPEAFETAYKELKK